MLFRPLLNSFYNSDWVSRSLKYKQIVAIPNSLYNGNKLNNSRITSDIVSTYNFCCRRSRDYHTTAIARACYDI